MKRIEAMQYSVNGIGVLAGTDIDFQQPTEFPCNECGGIVDLTSPITVRIVNMDGTETEQIMTEADARTLLSNTSIPLPPVICALHLDLEGNFEVKTWAQEKAAVEELDKLPEDCQCGIEAVTLRRLQGPDCPVHP